MSYLKNPSVVITCHGNADYDTMGALLAAQKIYQDAVILLPESRIKNVKKFFIVSMGYLCNMPRPDQVNYDQTTCLVIVGKRHGESLEAMEEIDVLLQKKDLEIHWYINGSGDEQSLKNSEFLPEKIHIRPYGSITSVLAEILKRKKIKTDPEEATIMALGIYEGTGMFTKTSTVAEDMEQAGYLLSCGADLPIVVSLVTQDMTMGFLLLINELTDNTSVHRINGWEVHLAKASALIPLTDLVGAVQKARQIESLDILFAIVFMDRTIYVAGATSLPDLDIRELLSSFHDAEYVSDDCVSMKSGSLSQIEAALIQHLQRKLRSPRDARSLMASPAITIAPEASCDEAASLMTRYNINTLLVVDPGDNTYKGYITRQIAEKTLFHRLGNQPVDAYMNNEISWVAPEAGLAEIEQKIMEGNHRVVPVISEKGIIGVITRTDLFSYLFRYKKARNAKSKDRFVQQSARRCQAGEMMAHRLSSKLLKLLKSFGKVGQEMGVEVYAVGGFVRDLVLDHPVDDLDIVVEGDAISFARYFAKRAGCRVLSHEKFNTAVIVFPDQFKVDAASARREYYTNPAALPIVEQSSIKMDLARRDFTINTLAIHLNSEDFGTMIDHFGALQDIREKVIRVIHNLSFVEDPTRIFRGVRFAGRFGFSIGQGTQKLIKNVLAIDGFKDVTGIRVLSEIKQIFCEDNPLPAIELMGVYHLEKVIHENLAITPELLDRCEAVRKMLVWHQELYFQSNTAKEPGNPGAEKSMKDPRKLPNWELYFMAILFGCSRQMSVEIASRLMMSGKAIQFIVEDRLRAEDVLQELEKESCLSARQIYWKVVEFIPDLVLYMMAVTSSEDLKKALRTFYTCHRTTKPAIRGKDLVQMKIPPGPVYTKIMKQIIDGRVQGEISSREQELALVRDYVKEKNLVPSP